MAVTIGLQVIPQHGDYEPMKRAWLEAEPRAHALIEERRHVGKVVLVP